jgi:hypothetical protein
MITKSSVKTGVLRTEGRIVDFAIRSMNNNHYAVSFGLGFIVHTEKMYHCTGALHPEEGDRQVHTACQYALVHN